MTWAVFQAQVASLGGGEQLNWYQWLIYATEVFFIEFGWPMAVGSVVFALPTSVLAYPVTFVWLRRYRRFLARQQGISYAEWRERYEAKR